MAQSIQLSDSHWTARLIITIVIGVQISYICRRVFINHLQLSQYLLSRWEITRSRPFVDTQKLLNAFSLTTSSRDLRLEAACNGSPWQLVASAQLGAVNVAGVRLPDMYIVVLLFLRGRVVYWCVRSKTEKKAERVGGGDVPSSF